MKTFLVEVFVFFFIQKNVEMLVDPIYRAPVHSYGRHVLMDCVCVEHEDIFPFFPTYGAIKQSTGVSFRQTSDSTHAE